MAIIDDYFSNPQPTYKSDILSTAIRDEKEKNRTNSKSIYKMLYFKTNLIKTIKHRDTTSVKGYYEHYTTLKIRNKCTGLLHDEKGPAHKLFKINPSTNSIEVVKQTWWLFGKQYSEDAWRVESKKIKLKKIT